MEEWLAEAYRKIESMPPQAKRIRDLAKEDLVFFARLVNPNYMYGLIHEEIYRWMQEYTLYGQGTSLSDNKLIMLPRGHLKSHMVGTWCAWMILRHPEITILYVSATATLAISQLYFIKNLLSGRVFMKYWPEYFNPDVGKREKWTASEIMVDHERRKSEGIRDASLITAGLTTNTTGWHADVIVADDLVVPENAYTEEGRELVAKKSSQFTSIRNTGGFTLACGTRYFPTDVYSIWKEMVYDEFDESNDFIGKKKVWDIKEFGVEEDGVFLWPRRIRDDNKAFGFDKQSLARIESEYVDKVQFFAQYYNNPNDPSADRISRDCFQYFNPRFLRKEGGSWYYNNRRLNIYAAVDFAYSLHKDADYTAIVVIGVDSEGNIFVLDIDRFKSFKVHEYFQHIIALHSKWHFKKLNAEVTAAQKTIVESIKDSVRKEGMTLKVEEYRPNKYEGSKEERIAATLEHRYENREVWHAEGGWTSVLEDELILAKPAHDDLKDALASAVTVMVKPFRSAGESIKDFLFAPQRSNKFGGFN
jgi:phage terminase large subunit-like protein